MHAWVDESMHGAQPGLEEGIYVLAATIADAAACEPARDTLRSLKPNAARKLHWKDADRAARRSVALTLSEVGPAHTIVIGAPLDNRRQERGRRLCMQRLLFELVRLNVTHVWLESRTQSLNARDREFFAALRSRDEITPTMSIEFKQPSVEPMLWFADVVAGAVGQARRGGDRQPFEHLRDTMTIHEIRL